ncbi:MAG: substrate-binding domain-containing protein, partial [Lachnospiraceae bacterium]|nr:substrate-binding domain-containing protein [Lachnospiraceae bacterium]
MSSRKLIGLITAVPETIHAKKVFEGVFAQCDRYGYNVAVFAPLAPLSSENREYVKGELNIYELMNFERLDGVIIDTISLIEDNDETLKDYIQEKLEKECNCPVVSLNLPVGAYPMVESRDEPIFREITEHVLDVHKVTDICFLTGPKDYKISEERLEVFQTVMKERGLTVKPEQVFYGDFWYTGGAALAEKVISGEVPMPEAVICASDHMAIGLARRLAENGVRIPQDIIITGFEATQEAALNNISITSFESNAVKTAAEAVRFLRGLMEPEEALGELAVEEKGHIHAGMSCGCAPDFLHSTRAFNDSFYYLYHDYSRQDKFEDVDIGQLMEGYVAERLSKSETPQECL